MGQEAIDGWIGEAVTRRAAAFSDQLRTCTATDQPVPGLEWTVADLAQHVACLPEFWMRQHVDGPDFERPVDFAAYSDQARAHITETDPVRLSELVEANFAHHVTVLAASDGPRWLYARKATSANLAGLALNELILHGRDLAAVTGAAKPAFERREANLAVDAIMVTTEFFIDEAKAEAQPDGVYHLHFRGGHDYTWTKNGGRLTITKGRPDKADARMSADPAMFLMTAQNRVSQIRTAITGGMIAYGRRPWRFKGLGTIAAEGV